MNHLSFQKPFRFSGKVQRFFRKALPLFLILAALSSCGKKDYAKMIPADAALVVRSNLKAVAEEAGGMEQLLKSAAASGNPLLAAVAGDPELCGIDPGEDVYLYASLNRDEPTLLFALADIIGIVFCKLCGSCVACGLFSFLPESESPVFRA